MAGLAVASPAVAQLRTTVTKYQYNADGALTAITKDVGGSSETTTYLTWDDFVPNANDPTTGAVQLGNGTLDYYGPNPGSANAKASFTFDARDRLVGYSGDAQLPGGSLPRAAWPAGICSSPIHACSNSGPATI